MKPNLGIEQLLELSLFHGELPSTVEWLLDCAEELSLEKGDVLIHPDATNDTLYIIIEGNLRVELKELGRPAITHIGAGECVGELSVLDGQPTAAYVVADQPVRLLAINRESLWRLIFTSHAVAKNLLFLLSARVRRDNEILSKSLALQHMYELNARTDALTGLYNRYWLDEMLPRLIERAHQSNEALGVMMLDVDHFKKYNDSYGHLSGDDALRMVAETVMRHIRPGDSAVRYGGEEILMILPGIDVGELIEVAGRIRVAISQTPVSGPDGRVLPAVTVSIGIAYLAELQNCLSLIAEADRALYLAKSGGRNRIVAAWEVG